MARFLETFNVIEQDGQWSNGSQPFDTLAAGVAMDTYDICNPETPDEPPEFALGVDVSPFAIKAYMKVPTRCAPGDISQYLEAAMVEAAEYTVTDALWNGANGNLTDIYLSSPDVTEVPRTGDIFAQLGTAIHTAYQQTPFLKPVIHLGFQSAMMLQLGLQTLGIPFVVAPGYPQDTIAVTGPIAVRLGSIEVSKAVDPSDNRLQIEATRLGRIEFDPHMAVRVANSAGS